MRLFVFAFFVICLYFNVRGQITLIPDPNFENELVIRGLDGVVDGQVLTNNIDTLTELSFGTNVIQDMTGIEDFVSLKVLNIGPQQLNTLNVSQNIALEELYVQNNNLTTLDLSQNVNLRILYLYNNQLTNINITQCQQLEYLSCWVNQLSSIDVSQNTLLKELDLSSNQLTTVDLTNNPLLFDLKIQNNQLTSLNVTQNPLLDRLDCHGNNLTAIDVTQNDSLRWFSCNWNQISSLNVSNNKKLESLSASGNLLTSIDLSVQRNILYNLELAYNNFTELNFSGYPALRELSVDSNLLTCLNVKNGHNQYLTLFRAHFNSNLMCIQVDDTAYSNNNWVPLAYWFDQGVVFETNCNNNCAVDIEEINIKKNVNIYPNPTIRNLNIQLKEKSNSTVTIYNISGKAIFNKEYTASDYIEINLDTPSGLYFVKIETENGTFTEKIIKQ